MPSILLLSTTLLTFITKACSSVLPLMPLHLQTSCVPALITPVVYTLIEKYID